MRCSECLNEIDPTDRSVWQKVEGWERPRVGGGTNAIALRKPVQEWMCATCMVRKKEGLGVNQGSLL